MEVVKHTKRPYQLLFLGLAAVSCLIYLVLNLPPGSFLSVYTVHIPYLFFFFVLLFLFLYSISAFIFQNAAQGLTIGSVVVVFFLFRLYNITHPFFMILLVVVLICIEGVLWKKRS